MLFLILFASLVLYSCDLDCSGNGILDEENCTCECDPFWTRQNCDYPACQDDLDYPGPTMPQPCARMVQMNGGICDLDWLFEECPEACGVCLCDAQLDCSGHGSTNDELNIDGCDCNCDYGWQGQDCSQYGATLPMNPQYRSRVSPTLQCILETPDTSAQTFTSGFEYLINGVLYTDAELQALEQFDTVTIGVRSPRLTAFIQLRDFDLFDSGMTLSCCADVAQTSERFCTSTTTVTVSNYMEPINPIIKSNLLKDVTFECGISLNATLGKQFMPTVFWRINQYMLDTASLNELSAMNAGRPGGIEASRMVAEETSVSDLILQGTLTLNSLSVNDNQTNWACCGFSGAQIDDIKCEEYTIVFDTCDEMFPIPNAICVDCDDFACIQGECLPGFVDLNNDVGDGCESTQAPSTTPTAPPSTTFPSLAPSISMPTKAPSASPSVPPTSTLPSAQPTASQPSVSPTISPSSSLPSASPSTPPTSTRPSAEPSASEPSIPPTISPSSSLPSACPSVPPTSTRPSAEPSASEPSMLPTDCPSSAIPSTSPSAGPTTSSPSTIPTASLPSICPSAFPTTELPSSSPTSVAPSQQPTTSPTSGAPTQTPTNFPTLSSPSKTPSSFPSSVSPSVNPSLIPSYGPSSSAPTSQPTMSLPSISPTILPSILFPSIAPSKIPSLAPVSTAKPSRHPTDASSAQRSMTLRFVGNYNQTLPDTASKQRFLLQCSKSLSSFGVACIDVNEGSIAVTFSGTTSQLESAYSHLTTNGLTGMSGFDNLPFYVPVLPTSFPTELPESNLATTQEKESSSSALVIAIIVVCILLCAVIFCVTYSRRRSKDSNLSGDEIQSSCIDLVEVKRKVGERPKTANTEEGEIETGMSKREAGSYESERVLPHAGSEGELRQWPDPTIVEENLTPRGVIVSDMSSYEHKSASEVSLKRGVCTDHAEGESETSKHMSNSIGEKTETVEVEIGADASEKRVVMESPKRIIGPPSPDLNDSMLTSLKRSNQLSPHQGDIAEPAPIFSNDNPYSSDGEAFI